MDNELVRRGLAASRTEAQRFIAEGLVTVAGAPAAKPAAQVAPAEALHVQTRATWASRGGHKLAGALADLGVAPGGRHCLDAGASTGGFTDVLLEGGAAGVVAVDVGYGQLAWRLRTDERVVVLDRTNVRDLAPGQVPPPAVSLVVADLSFISLTLVIPALTAVAAPGADHVLMVKPQFEVGPADVGRGGVVRDPSRWDAAMRRVLGAAEEQGLRLAGAAASGLPGPSGNVEFFVHLRTGAAGDVDALLGAAVARGRDLGAGK